MTPEAFKVVSAGDVRVPRTIFEHAHTDGNANFPVSNNTNVGEIFMLMPDNLNGLDKLVLWWFSTGTEANETFNCTINIGTCAEAFNTHTQTVNGIDLDLTANQYKCVDITALFATVLANLTSRDMLWIIVTHATGDEPSYLIGAELQET